MRSGFVTATGRATPVDEVDLSEAARAESLRASIATAVANEDHETAKLLTARLSALQ